MAIIYDVIGTGYNSTRRADPYLTGRLLYFLGSAAGKHFLDIGCGTGNYTIALANKGLTFTGVDPSEEMLTIARERNQTVDWIPGSAENIPAADDMFDGVIATLTIHHWTHLDSCLREIYRVTKPGGRMVLFTATPRQMKGYWLNHYFPHMMRSSIGQMPPFDTIKDALTNAGFQVNTTEAYFVTDDLQDHFLYAGKHNPEMYLDERMRRGISSFAALANAGEVKQGLDQLRDDLKSGAFEAIKASFENTNGDYLFVVAEKH